MPRKQRRTKRRRKKRSASATKFPKSARARRKLSRKLEIQTKNILKASPFIEKYKKYPIINPHSTTMISRRPRGGNRRRRKTRRRRNK